MKTDVEPAIAAARRERRSFGRWLGRAWRRFPGGLSSRLLVLTLMFVLIGGVFINLVSLTVYRTEILRQRLEAAQLAALALEASTTQAVNIDLTEELLANAGVLSVVLKRNDERSLFLSPGQMPRMAVERYDLESRHYVSDLIEAIKLFARHRDRVISVQGVPRLEGGSLIETQMHEAPIRAAMMERARFIFVMSLLVSVTTGICVYWAIHLLFVRPLLRIEAAMTRFRGAPEDAKSVIVPSERADEVGKAERELAAMQADLRLALRQQTRLAALGTAVSKINHDLRNSLASAQLFVDRLGKSEDPQVQRLAPKLVAALDRAVRLCTETLRFGKAEETPPNLRAFDLFQAVEDVEPSALQAGGGRVRWCNDVPPETYVVADSEQIFRVLLNLTRNAAEAIASTASEGEVRVSSLIEREWVVIDISDTGPGLPREARARLFQPFSSSGRPGGTGLGLAIAAELVRGHGGEIVLKSTGVDGSVFRIRLPRAPRGE